MKTPLLTLALTVTAFACGSSDAPPPTAPGQASSETAEGPTCGPQSPRDISMTEGTNAIPVPAGETPNLCNVHFHDPHEHAGFASIPAVADAPGTSVCKSVNVGDQVEFHWVYTNCPVNPTPIKGLANCVCDREDMVLRVYAQAYVVGEDGVAPSQPTGDTLSYAGSTTGPSYDDKTCSPAKVNWEVARSVDVVGKSEMGAWCANNPWPGEDQPHGSRAPVTAPAWLSPI